MQHAIQHDISVSINEAAMKQAVMEIKLSVNRRLYEKKVITEEMYSRAKELILKGE